MDCSPPGSTFPWDSPGKEYCSGLPCLPPRNLPDPGIELLSLTSPALAGGFFTTSASWEAPTWAVPRINLIGFSGKSDLGMDNFNSILNFWYSQGWKLTTQHTILPVLCSADTGEGGWLWMPRGRHGCLEGVGCSGKVSCRRWLLSWVFSKWSLGTQFVNIF